MPRQPYPQDYPKPIYGIAHPERMPKMAEAVGRCIMLAFPTVPSFRALFHGRRNHMLGRRKGDLGYELLRLWIIVQPFDTGTALQKFVAEDLTQTRRMPSDQPRQRKHDRCADFAPYCGGAFSELAAACSLKPRTRVVLTSRRRLLSHSLP